MRPEHWIYTARLRVRSLLRRKQVEDELAAELADHVDHLIQENIARGLSPQEARDQAMRAMDGIEQRKEECRDARRVRYIEDFFRDTRFALRTMRRSPVFALTAILSLALGIGANTAIFTAVDAVLWKPLPVEHPENLVRFELMRQDGRQMDQLPMSLAQIRRKSDVFVDAIGTTDDGLSFTYDGRAERILGGCVSPNYFTFLGVKTVLGEPFSAGVRAGHWAAEAVLSYRFWKSRFAGDPHVIGRVIHLNTYPFTVVGVSAPSFYDLERGLDPELRIPVLPEGQTLAQIELIQQGKDDSWNVMARLRPGVTLAQAGTVMDGQFQATAAAQRLKHAHVRALPGDKGWSLYLRQFSTPLFVLFGLVGGVLLIACANVAGMLLARAAARRRELAMRASAGAGRGRLIRQMLAESVLLSLIGGAAGIAAAYWSGPLLLHFLPRSNINLALDLEPDLRALLYTSSLAILTGILFGLIPALQATRGDLAGTLKADSAAAIGERQSAFFRTFLVAAQVAFSMVLLIAAGLFIRTFVNLRPHEMSVNPDRVLQFMFKPQLEIYSDARKYALTDELIRRVSAVPGVESVVLTQPGPFTGYGENGLNVWIPGHDPVRIVDDEVTPGIFSTFGIKLLAGRDFNRSDKPGAPLVAVINQSMARALYDSDDPVGRTFQRKDGLGTATFQVIGVVADVHYYNLRSAPQPAGFFAFQRAAPYMPVLQVRTNNSDTAGMIAAIRKAFDDVDKGFPIFNIKTMSMQIDDALARERMVANFAAGFGVLALVLAAVGLYGVLAYLVARRTREIGIRMALGSGAAPVIWLVVKQALLLVGIGCAAGIGIALAAGRSIAAYLFGVSPLDPVTLFGASALMLAIAAVAASVPALRASRVDPLIALRCE